MRKLMVAVLVAVLLTSSLVFGCVPRGSTNLKTEHYKFSDFTRIDVSSAFEVEIVQSGSYSVSITADDNLFDNIRISKEDEKLKIGLKTITIIGSSTLKAKITMPRLRGLDLSGATRGTVSGFSSAENVDIEISGASHLDLLEMSSDDIKFDIDGASKVTGNIAAGDAKFDLDGASTIQLEGSANDIVVDASGASHVKLAGFVVNDADVRLSGASTSTVNLNGRLNADLEGASKLSYIGTPTMGNIKTSGGSTLGKN